MIANHNRSTDARGRFCYQALYEDVLDPMLCARELRAQLRPGFRNAFTLPWYSRTQAELVAGFDESKPSSRFHIRQAQQVSTMLSTSLVADSGAPTA